ncbi:unnamed protein product [Larinioides sclopetarius]|uniref:Uncharacterized protein n=1 Tax=Larinioides sclopetarius TaxID=280406 RepID=A0AAV1ZDZ2_9ARAC
MAPENIEKEREDLTTQIWSVVFLNDLKQARDKINPIIAYIRRANAEQFASTLFNQDFKANTGGFSSSTRLDANVCGEFRVNRVLMVSYKASAAIVMERCSTSEF